MARSLSKGLFRASQAVRSAEVITGTNGVARYAKRRARRVERRTTLGWLNRKTGL